MNKRHYEHTLPNIRGSLSNTYDHTPSPLDKGLSFAVIGETGKLEFTPEIVNGWDTWKSLPKRVSEKGKTVYVFRKIQLIKVIKPKKLES